MRILARYIKDINDINPPLLQVAANREQSNLGMIMLLLDLGADVNAQYQLDSNSWSYDNIPRIQQRHTLLHKMTYGWYWWYTKALKILIEKGADYEMTDSNEMTCLQVSLSKGTTSHGFWRQQCLDILLAAGANVNRLHPKTSLTPLNMALESRLGMETVQKLLDHGADMLLGNNPPLLSAIRGADVEATRAMLKAGADPNGLMSSTLTTSTMLPLQEAADAWCECEFGSDEGMEEMPALMKLLLEHGADPYKETVSSTIGQTKVFHHICSINGPIEPFLSKDIDLEVKDTRGRTPLHAACSYYGYIPQGGLDFVAEKLIEADADVTALDNDGNTPLHHAVQSGSDLSTVIQRLIYAGASAKVKDHDGRGPLHYALRNCEWEANTMLWSARELIDAGANGSTNGDADVEKSDLHIIAGIMAANIPFEEQNSYKTDYDEWVRLYDQLVEAGCNREAMDESGNTPAFDYIMKAGTNNENGRGNKGECLGLSYCRNFLSLHNILATNKNGDTLLHAAAKRQEAGFRKRDSVDLFRVLMDMGLDPKKVNMEGVSAIDVAAMYEKEELLVLFESENLKG